MDVSAVNLNERKIKILQAIISNYLETAEPVGSRTISRKFDLGISSATIRNEMSDLEDLGFIVQPHTSAGRIPSDQGYRLYVDELMNYEELEKEHIQIIRKLLQKRIDRLEILLQEISKLLSILTNYTTMVSTPQYKRTKLKKLQLIPLDDHSIILVIATDGNMVKNCVIPTANKIDSDTLFKLSTMLNHHLEGLTVEEIHLPLIQQIKKEMGIHSELFNSVLDAVAESIETVDDADVYTSGTTNLFNFPEFNNIIKVKSLLHTLEEKQVLINVLNHNLDQGTDITITIGEENTLDEIKECSIVTTKYKIAGKTVGSIGIIGPTRMNYAKVVSTLRYLIDTLDYI